MMKAIALVTEQVTMTVSTVYPCQKHDFQPDSYDIPVKEVVTCK